MGARFALPGFLGIDPGLSGAIAYLWRGQLIVWDVPTATVTVGGKQRRRVDGVALARIFKVVQFLEPDAGAIEAVHGWSRPRGKNATGREDSASAAFAFGHVTGRLQQCLESTCSAHSAIPPQRWQRALGLIGKDKNASRLLAQSLYPESAHMFARVKDDGRAEAALLAYYLQSQALCPA